MYTGEQMTRLFRRYLKESGEYSKYARDTNIVHIFDLNIHDNNPFKSKDIIIAGYNHRNCNFIYELDNFHKYMYESDEGETFNEVKDCFEQFVKKRDFEGIFLKNINDYIKKLKEEQRYGMHIRYDGITSIGSIEEYMEARKTSSPYSLITRAHVWPMDVDRPLYMNMHQGWFKTVMRLMRDTEKKKKAEEEPYPAQYIPTKKWQILQ